MRDPKDDVARLIMFIERHVETKGICTIAKCVDTDVFWLYYRDPEGQEYLVHPALGAFPVKKQLLVDYFKLYQKATKQLVTFGLHFELHNAGAKGKTEKLKYTLPGLKRLNNRDDGVFIDCVTGDEIKIRRQMRTEVLPDYRFNAGEVSKELIIGTKLCKFGRSPRDIYNKDFVILPESHLMYRLVEKGKKA